MANQEEGPKLRIKCYGKLGHIKSECRVLKGEQSK